MPISLSQWKKRVCLFYHFKNRENKATNQTVQRMNVREWRTIIKRRKNWKGNDRFFCIGLRKSLITYTSNTNGDIRTLGWDTAPKKEKWFLKKKEKIGKLSWISSRLFSSYIERRISREFCVYASARHLPSWHLITQLILLLPLFSSYVVAPGVCIYTVLFLVFYITRRIRSSLKEKRILAVDKYELVIRQTCEKRETNSKPFIV